MMYSHFLCDHGIDLGAQPCHVCENKPGWNWIKDPKDERRQKLESAGYKIGDTKDFLGLTDDEDKTIKERICKENLPTTDLS